MYIEKTWHWSVYITFIHETNWYHSNELLIKILGGYPNIDCAVYSCKEDYFGYENCDGNSILIYRYIDERIYRKWELAIFYS